MSGRLVRRLLKEQQAQQLQLAPQDEEVTESPSLESPDRPCRNPFDLLEDDQVDESDSVAEGEVALEISNGKGPSAESKPTIPMPNNNKHRKNKNKKTKDNIKASSSELDDLLGSALEGVSLSNFPGNEPLPTGREIVNLKNQDHLSRTVSTSTLSVDLKYLNSENELKRIFGSKVVKSAEKNQRGTSSRQSRGGRGAHHIYKRTIIVSPVEHWPRWDGSLSMESLETKDGYHYFRYVHSSSYSNAQKTFEIAKANHDLNGITGILHHNPYHVESLITMANYFKFVGEPQMAEDAIRKSLYALECAWHPMFSPLKAKCQVKYSHDTNKPLFSTLIMHIMNMDRRGCNRSALEACKLLLGIDSDDPMGALFCIDYHALRAEEYSWLECFAEEYKNDNSLWVFPNFSYSLAICRFYLECKMASKDKASSTELMRQALLLHPSVLKKLVAKVPLKDRSWSDILKNRFFSLGHTGIPSLDHLINIYVERSYIIWRLPDLQKLLKDAAVLVIESLKCREDDAGNWACVRREIFSSDKNEYSHLLVSDFSDSVPTMPPDELQHFIIEPRMREEQNGVGVDLHEANDNAIRDLENRTAVAAFFESMLPWVPYRGGGADQADRARQQDGN